MSDYLEVLWNLPDKPKSRAELDVLARGPEHVVAYELAKRDGKEKFLGQLEERADDLVDDAEEKGWLKRLFAKARRAG